MIYFALINKNQNHHISTRADNYDDAKLERVGYGNRYSGSIKIGMILKKKAVLI